MIKKAFILFLFVFSFLLVNNIKNVSAEAEQFLLADTTTDFNVTVIGNNSITYNVSITFNTSLNFSSPTFHNTTLSIYVPYGMRNNSNFCNSTGFVNSFRTINLTHEVCDVSLGNITNTTDTLSNRTFQFLFTSTVNSFTNYNISERFWADVNCSSVTANISGAFVRSCTMNTTTLSNSFGKNWWVNPRPWANYSSNSMNDSFLKFIGWRQTRPYYEVWVPLMTWNESRKRPIAANATYAEVIYADKPFFENPDYFEMWSYNLTFIIYNGSNNNINYTYDIFFPAIDATFQVLRPLLVQNISFTDITNTTRSQTVGFPAASGFTVYFANDTLRETHTDTTLFNNYSINISFNSNFGIARDFKVFTVTAPPNRGNITLSVQLTVVGSSGTTVSPIYVHNQVIGGFDPTDAPPSPGSNISMNFIIEANNSLLNFTLDDLRLHFLAPKNVTITNISLFANLSRNVNLTFKQAGGVWNLTKNTAGAAINESDFCTNMTDGITGSPSAGYRIQLCFFTWDINLSADAFNAWYPGLQNRSNLTANLTATMSFPVLNKSINLPNTDGTSNSYNATLSMSQAGSLNLSSELTGIGSSVNSTVVVHVDGQRLTNGPNYTVGSLLINNLGSGTHSVSVSYSIAAASTTTTTTGGGSTTTGGTTEPPKKGHSEKQLFIKITPGAASIMKIVDKEIGFKEIIIMVKNQANTVLITVTKLDGQPAHVTHTINGTVYKYIEVNKSNIEDSNLQDLKIRFEVLKSWLTDNKFDKEKLYLYRYSNGWQKLPTTIYSETNTTIDYEATTPGFSVFAIAAENIAGANVGAPLEGEVQPPIEQPPVTPEERPNLVWLWVLLGVLAVGIIVFVVIKNRKK